ncbi:hypothetical protein [Polynucleobacter difficilis]|uniref:hypothetical protein n=1 Tax=Polynucleobacter difficilis TaxID=556054 RepID=UPI001F1D6223|nr:hypothetical protein [Polynucleobacter difficilis]
MALQLSSHADQAALKSSSCQPGICCHATGLKLAIELVKLAAGALLSIDGVRCPGARVGGLAHPASKTSTRAHIAIRLDRCSGGCLLLLQKGCKFIIMIANLLDQYPMLLFVLEGLLALCLLLFIVFWTSKGRKED